MKRFNTQQLIILALLALLAYQFFFAGNRYKREYEKMLKEREAEYKEQIQSLENQSDSILKLNKEIEKELKKIDGQIDRKDAQINKLRKQYEKDVAKLDAMSDNDIADTFTDAFN